MYHSVIIPHRNKNRQIYQSIWSVARSAELCGMRRYEIIIVDHASRQHPWTPCPFARLVVCDDPIGVLNKPRLLNLGIEAARGDVLTFLDADMIVGKCWMEGAIQLASDPAITRLCYRVRQLKVSGQMHQNSDIVLAMLERMDALPQEKAGLLDYWFRRYEEFTKAFEARGEPEGGNNPPDDGPIFGNSQFSVRRDVLGDLRFDEEFCGAGFEDIWMAWALWKRAGDKYQGVLASTADHALLHIWHGTRFEELGSDWYPPYLNSRNQARYYEYKTGERTL